MKEKEEPTSIVVVQRKGIKKGIYIIPSAFTIGNILCGFYATINSLKAFQLIHEPDQAAILFDQGAKAIGIAWLLDGLDGRIARMTNTTSEFGVELDSIADVLSFGLAPAIMVYAWGYGAVPGLEQLGWAASLLFLICGALRLARFNVIAKSHRFSMAGASPKLDKRYFVGLPIPAAAGGLAAIVHFTPHPLTNYPLQTTYRLGQLSLVLVVALAALMVSTLKYASFKDVGATPHKPFIIFPLIALLIAAIWFYSQSAFLIISLVYISHGIALKLWAVTSKRKRDNKTQSKPVSLS